MNTDIFTQKDIEAILLSEIPVITTPPTIVIKDDELELI